MSASSRRPPTAAPIEIPTMAPFESPLEAGWGSAADAEDARAVEGEVVEDTFEELELLVCDSPVVVEDAMAEDDTGVLVLVVKRVDTDEAWAVVALDDATEEEFCNPSSISQIWTVIGWISTSCLASLSCRESKRGLTQGVGGRTRRSNAGNCILLDGIFARTTDTRVIVSATPSRSDGRSEASQATSWKLVD